MKKNKLSSKKNITLYCFTPLASLVTFIIEISLALYVILRYKMSSFGRLSALLIALLGLFQLSEYLICKSSTALLWSKIGFISITFLPIVGLNLVEKAKGQKIWSKIGYIFAAILSFIIAFIPNVIESISCPGKFVIFNTANLFNSMYEIYYFGFILLAFYVLIGEIIKNTAKKELYSWMLVGYASFLVPTLFLYVINTFMREGTVSIMCGFAVLLALILVFKIIPLEKKLNKILK